MRACGIPELRARVKADPKAALAEEGVDLPFDEARVVEDTPETTHIALTDPNAELSDEQMETVVGGTTQLAWHMRHMMDRYHHFDGPDWRQDDS